MNPRSFSAVGLLETTGYTPAAVALDAMQKATSIEVLQAEINDFLGVIIKIGGELAQVERAIEIGVEWANRLQGKPVSRVLSLPSEEISGVLLPRIEYNPLIQQNVVHLPTVESTSSGATSVTNSSTSGNALGFIETQGFTAVFQAIDMACKAANVEVIGKEKLGGGYVTVVIKGDVAAVHAAIESGQQEVESLGKLIAAHVIPRPSASVLSLLPG
ncbi:MAG: BMC domain-containing protein [Planctomycetota bacterium]|nr:BMC domain-containing protein [Planctomycetota bacterium]